MCQDHEAGQLGSQTDLTQCTVHHRASTSALQGEPGALAQSTLGFKTWSATQELCKPGKLNILFPLY